jgi:protocatechuate 3,4-dioxygenase beta subunit
MAMRLRRVLLVATAVAALLALLLYRRSTRPGAPEGKSVATSRAPAGSFQPGPMTPTIWGPAHERVRRAPAGRLRGRVTESGGGGVKGALVCARGRADDIGDDQLGDPFCTSSGEDGAFEIASLHAAHYELDANAAGYLPGRYRQDKRETVILTAGELKTGLDLVLRPGGVEVRGRVKDIGAGGVAFALVELRSSQSGGWQSPLSSARADERGDFRVTVAPGPLDVYASSPGYTQGYKRTAAPGSLIEVLLTPEAVLVGQVVMVDSGEPVAGAEVHAGPVDQTEWLSHRSATSNDEGKFRIERLAPGRYKPTAITGEGRGKAANSVLLGLGGRSAEIVIHLHQAARLSGAVFLADGKSPCQQGWVQITDKKANLSGSATIQPRGDFVLPGVLPGSYRIQIWCERQPDFEVATPLEVGTRSLFDLRYVLTGGRQVSGVVERAGGGGVANASLQLQTSGGDPRGQQRWSSAESRADGSFQIDGVVPGSYLLHVDPPEQPPLEQPMPVTVAAGQDVRGLRVMLEPAGALTGVVVDQDGRPVKGAQISATGDRNEWGQRQTVSADDGSFDLPGLPEGEYHVVAMRSDLPLRAPGKHDDDVPGTRTKIKPGSKSHVRLVVERESGTIKGRVLQGGKPVTDAFVDAQRENESAAIAEGDTRRTLRGGWDRQPALTDSDGGFEVKDLGPGKYSVRAFRKGGGEAVAEHVAVGSSVTLVITPTGLLQGRVTVAGGRAPESFDLNIEDAKEGFSRSERFVWTDGAWTMADLPAGTFVIGVTAREGTAELKVPLPEGQTRSDLVLTLTPKAKVRGRIVALDTGKPLPGMQVSASAASQSRQFMLMGGAGDRRNVTDADGRFEIDDAPAGKVALLAFSQDWTTAQYRWVRGRADLRAGEVNEIPALKCPRSRVKPPARGGDLGYELKQSEPDPNDPPVVHTVAVVRPEGPAAASGLKAGDVIVSVDGQDVTGPNDHLLYGLTEVPRGTTIKLGLARGATVSITAASPL